MVNWGTTDTYIWKCVELYGDCCKLASLQTSVSGKNLHRLVIRNTSIHQDYGYHESQPISFTLVVNDFGVKYKTKNDIDH
jgi:hypothetical protein